MKAASAGLDVETIVVDDATARGPSWARNEGLRRATGEVIFFADADDAVRPTFFSAHLQTLSKTGSDFVLSNDDFFPLKHAYDLTGNAAVRAALLPAFFGFSFEDVRRWNAGGDFFARREMGGVWRGAYRRDFLEKNAIRFDESLRLFEDAAFLAECATRATRVVTISESLYDYTPGVGGVLSTRLKPDVYYPYKFAALKNREAVAARAGGDVMRYFEASAVFSAIELLKARRGFVRYAQDAFVRDALFRFPTSWRHPLVASAVFLSRALIAAFGKSKSERKDDES